MKYLLFSFKLKYFFVAAIIMAAHLSATAIDLDDYCLADQAEFELLSEYSGITINRHSHYLVMIAEEDGLLVQTRWYYGTDNYISQLSIGGLGTCGSNDFEAIAFLFRENSINYYALLNEACNEVVIVKIDNKHETIDEHISFKVRHTVSGQDRLRSVENDGLEGICYNAISGELFVVEEEEDGSGSAYYDKPGLYKLNTTFTNVTQLPANNSTQQVSHISESLSSNSIDYSGCYHLSNVDPANQDEILIVSQKSETLYLLNTSTNTHTSMSLSGLSNFQKLEGVCLFQGRRNQTNSNRPQMFITSDNGGGSGNTHFKFIEKMHRTSYVGEGVCADVLQEIDPKIYGSGPGNVTYNWSPSPYINGSRTGPTVDLQTSVPTSLTLEIQDGFCTLSQTFDFDIDAPVDADFTYSVNGMEIQMEASNQNQGTYGWYINGSYISNASSVTHNVPFEDIYSVRLYVTNGCGQTDNYSQNVNVSSSDYSFIIQGSQYKEIVQTDDGNIIGLDYSEPTGISKLDKTGTSVWRKHTSGTDATQISNNTRDLIKCQNGDLLGMGHSKSNIWRINQNGELLWGYTLNGNGLIGNVVEDNAGNAYVLSDNDLIKFDINGDILWSYDGLQSHSIHTDGQHITLSESENHLFLMRTESNGESKLLKINTGNGLIVWTKKFNQNAEIRNVMATKNGVNNLIITALPNLILLVDESGNIVTSKSLNHPDGNPTTCYIYKVECTPQNIYIATDTLPINPWIPIGSVQTTRYLSELNYNLNPNWTRSYYKTEYLLGNQSNFKVNDDGSLLLAGSTLIKTDIEGNTCLGYTTTNITASNSSGANFVNSTSAGISNTTNIFSPGIINTSFQPRSQFKYDEKCINCKVANVYFDHNPSTNTPLRSNFESSDMMDADIQEWYINGKFVSDWDFWYTFPHPGVYLVRLDVYNGSCFTSIEETINIGPTSSILDFVPTISDHIGCSNSYTLTIGTQAYDDNFDFYWFKDPDPANSNTSLNDFEHDQLIGYGSTVETTYSGPHGLLVLPQFRGSSGHYQDFNVDISSTCVVPGDLNADGQANARDVIQFGLAFGDNGAARVNNNTDWQEYQAVDWGENLNNGVDKKSTDADGNGIVDIADYSVLANNFNQVHNNPHIISQPAITNTSEATISLIPNEIPTLDCSNATKQIKFDIQVSNSELYGAYIELDYQDNLEVLQNLRVEFGDSWFGKVNQDIFCVDDIDSDENKLKIGVSRIDHIARNGSGLFCQLVAEVDNSCSYNDIPLNFSLTEVELNKENGEVIPTTILNNGLSNPIVTLISEECTENYAVYPGGQISNMVTARNEITTNGIIEINSGSNTSFEANCIELNRGFVVSNNTNFEAIINPCNCDNQQFIEIEKLTKPNQELLGLGADMNADGNNFAFTDPDNDEISLYKNLNGVFFQLGTTLKNESLSSFGDELRISSDGNRIAVQSYADKSIRVYETNGNSWTAIGNTLFYDEHISKFDFSGNGDKIVISSKNDDENGFTNNGKVDAFTLTENTWTLIGDISGTSDNENLGTTVVISNNGNVVAFSNSNQTFVYNFDFQNNNWNQLGSAISGITPSISDDGFTVLVSDGSNNSSVFTFNQSSSNWVQKGTTQNAGFSTQGHFISGDGNTYGFGRKARLQIYKWDGTDWQATQLFTTSGASYFGRVFRFSTDGNAMVVGAYGDDAPGNIHYLETECY